MIVFGGGLRFYLLKNTGLYAGINYPKKQFQFINIYDGEWPPSSAFDRLNAGAAYPEAFIITLKQSDNDFKVSDNWTIFVNKPYKILHINELRYEWEDNNGIFSKGQSIGMAVDRYVAKDGWYWYGWLGDLFECDFFECNPEKLFTGKELGDEFKLRLELVYSFDDEPENMQILEYNVEVYKGEYESPFFGWL
jgi:hypothetical protein